MVPAEHVAPQINRPPVPVDIRDVHSHRGKRDLSDSQPINSPKFAVALVNPDAIGCGEIIADV